MSHVNFIFLNRAGPHPSLCDAWRTAIAQHITSLDQHRFEVVESTLQKLEPPHSQFDCVVSPANSYGIMDGGFDYYLSEALSPKDDQKALTRVAQSAIKARHYGFAPPGTCTLTQLPVSLGPNAFNCKFMAIVPTMPSPCYIDWHRDIVYNSMWALLVELERWNERAEDGQRINKVLMTGLGTGTGGITAETCAQQMIIAVKHFLAARSEEGKKNWEKEGFPRWHNVLPLTTEVVEAYRQ